MNYVITVNGKTYSVTVEKESAAKAAPKAAAAPSFSAAPKSNDDDDLFAIFKR